MNYVYDIPFKSVVYATITNELALDYPQDGEAEG